MERNQYFIEYFKLCKEITNSEDIEPLINLSIPHLKKFATVLKDPTGRELFKEATNNNDEGAISQFEERLDELIDDLQSADNDDTDTSTSDNNDEPHLTENVQNNGAINNVVGENPVNGGGGGVVENGNGRAYAIEVLNNNVPIYHGGVSENEEPEETVNPRSVPSTIVITDDDDNKTIDLISDEEDDTLTAVDRLQSNTAEERPPTPSRERSLSSAESSANEEEEQNNSVNEDEEENAEVNPSSQNDDDEEFIPQRRTKIISPSESEDETLRKRRRSRRFASSSSERDDSRRRRKTAAESSSDEEYRKKRRRVRRKEPSPKSSSSFFDEQQQPCSSKHLRTAKKEEDKKPQRSRSRQPNFPPTKGMPRELANLQMSYGAQEARKNKIQPYKEVEFNYKIPSSYSSPTKRRQLTPSSASKSEQEEKDDDAANKEKKDDSKTSIPFNKMIPIQLFRYGKADISGKQKLYIKVNETQCWEFLFDRDIETSDSVKVYYCYECRKYRKVTHAVLYQETTEARVDPNHHKKCSLIRWEFS